MKKPPASAGAEMPRFYGASGLTPTDYKRSAMINLWAAKIMRQHGDLSAARAHLALADLYIKQELRRAVSARAPK